MGKGAVRATSALVFLLSLAQAAIAIAIVYLITRRLYKQEVDTDNRTINTECGLDKRGDVERDLCEWGIGGVAATFAVLLATSLCLCFTCNCGNSRLGPALTFIAQLVLCIGWAIYAGWVTNAVRAINGLDQSPEWNTSEVKDARSWVVGLSWAEAAVFGIMASLSLFTGLCCPPNKQSTI